MNEIKAVKPELDKLMQALKENHVSGYQETMPVCLDCDDTGFIIVDVPESEQKKAKRCGCKMSVDSKKRARTMREKIEGLGIPIPEKLNQDQKKIESVLIAKKHRGAWLYGQTGTGKTSYVVYQLFRSSYKKTFISDGLNLADELRLVLPDAKYVPKKINPTEYDVIFIDDIDKSKMSTALKVDVYKLLHDVTNQNIKTPFYITSNMSIEKFCKFYFDSHFAEPLARRLDETCFELHCSFTQPVQQDIFDEKK